jgi:hypothetical protein
MSTEVLEARPSSAGQTAGPRIGRRERRGLSLLDLVVPKMHLKVHKRGRLL